MLKKNLVLAFVSVMLTFVNINVLAEIKTLRFATSLPYAPFVVLKDNNEYSGLDIDIAKALCKKFNAQYIFNSDKIVNMIPSLKAGKYDIWIGGIAITEERKKEIAFSNPYFSSTLKLITTDASIKTAEPNDLKGKIVGIIAGSTHGQYANDTYGKVATIKIFRTPTDALPISTPAALTALKDGKIDATISDELVLKQWLDQQPDSKRYHLINLSPQERELTRQHYAFAVAKNNTELLEEINKTLAAIKTDGTYDEILKKYSLKKT